MSQYSNPKGVVPLSLSLDRDDTAVLKALAMLLIVAHNFFHLVPPSPVENEFAFGSAKGIWQAIAICVQFPGEIFHVLLAFFGHYGVVIFIFLSGYGLTRKLVVENPLTREWHSAWNIVERQVMKMVCLIMVGALLVFVWRFVTMGAEFSLTYEVNELLKLLTFTNNLRPDSLWGFVSVWWFFALIVQLYLLFPLMVWGLRHNPTFTTVLTLAGLGAAQVWGPVFHGVTLYATSLSHAVIFLTGIWLGQGKRLPGNILPWAWCVLLLSQFVSILFPVSFLALLFCTLDLWQRYGRRLFGKRCLVWFGGMSSFVFLVHGWLRHPVVDWLDQFQRTQFLTDGGFLPWLTLGIFVLWFIAVVVVAVIARQLYRPVFQWLDGMCFPKSAAL